MPSIAPGGETCSPVMLPCDCRFAGDDWTLPFIVYAEPPSVDEVSGAITSGVPQDLTGCSVSGTAYLQTRSANCLFPAPIFGPLLKTLAGTVVDPENGLIQLTLGAADTSGFTRQDPFLWQRENSDVRRALLIVRPVVAFPDTGKSTIGLLPLFVF